MNILILEFLQECINFGVKKFNIKYLMAERGIPTLGSIATIHAFQALRLEKSLGNTTINQYLFLITESVSVA